MVVNNWFVTCDMCCYVYESNWPRIYFATFWVITVLIVMNVMISFVLETYSEVQQKYEKAQKRVQFVLKLKKSFKDLN